MKNGLSLLILATALGSLDTHAQTAPERKLPLPDAPVQLVIPDGAAFDAALSGGFRKALSGTLSPGDPAGSAFRRTRVGEKLAAQWELFAEDLPLTWKEIAKLKPKSLALALLSTGDLEAVLVIRTALAPLPLKLPGGKELSHNGAPYRLASRGAGDDRTASRRLGLAWASSRGDLILASSERAMKLALDRSLADEGVDAFLPGLASLRLDLTALEGERYFKREFLFQQDPGAPRSGIVLAALLLEGDALVEVRKGEGETRPAAPSWETSTRPVLGAGWETTGSADFFAALRRGFLETVSQPSDLPVTQLRKLPDPGQTDLDDRYLVDLTKPQSEGGARSVAAPDLGRWQTHLQSPPVAGWGWECDRPPGGTDRDGARRLIVARPASLDADFGKLCEETLSRISGPTRRRVEAGATELTVGPGLPAIAWKRTGELLWIARRAQDLTAVPEPRLSPDLVRWARLDLGRVRGLKDTWARAEGAFSPQETRPFSDRILGLLGWMPATRTLSVERRRDGARFEERVVFSAPPGETAPRDAAPSKPKPSSSEKKTTGKP